LGWPEQPYVGYVLGIELIGSFIISVCYPLFKSFTRDIYFSDFLGKITGKKPDNDAVNAEMDENQSVQPVQEIASVTSPQVDKPLLTPQTPSDVQPNTTDKQPEQNVDVNTQQQQQQDQSKPEDAPKIEEEKPAENNTTTTPPTTDTQANTAAANKKPATAKPTQTLSTNKEFDEFLTNKDAKEVFKQFLVREFSVENLMFYTEVQYFKKLTDQEEIEETSNQIYETYVQAGAPFEINISADKRSKVEQFVKSKPVPLDAFFEAEKAVYTAMEKESFPRFQKNKLYLNYKKEFGSNIASKKPTSAKKPPPKKK
jgi:regulator of G-protein signaling